MKHLVILHILFSSFLSIAQRNTKPKIIVGIVVDQMCYDYLYRFQKNFSKNGFNRFLNKGVNFRNSTYNYVPTYTGPGHASIYTGTTPSNHGIVGNEWFDKDLSTVVNCVSDPKYASVGTNSSEGKCSPKNLKTYTITDQLKLTYPKSKVISISIKDRSAILPGGHLSDGSYWFDYTSGKFITSTFFDKKLPDWLEQFNSMNNANSYTKKWDLLFEESKYSSTDDTPYEMVLTGKEKPTFPYDFPNLKGSASYFTLSPFANTLLTDLALASIEGENLGKSDDSDFLAMSYSTPDILGHSFGPYSREIEDMYYRLDREIERLINSLEKKFGKKNIAVILTADHAVVPVPQMLQDLSLPGGYIFMDNLIKDLKDTLVLHYKHKKEWILTEENQQLYLDLENIKSEGFNVNEVARFLKENLLKMDGIKAAYTQEELIYNVGFEDEWKAMVRKGYSYMRSGEVVFIVEPGYLTKSTDLPKAHQGTSHGSSFNYDAHVPLLWYGLNWKKKEVFTPYEIVDIAPTLVHLLDLQRPGAMTGKPLIELLNDEKR